MRPIFAALAGLATFATVASVSSPASAKSAVEGSSDQVVLRPAANGRFCTPAQMITGSNIPRKICKTRAEWLAEGARSTPSAS